MGLHHITMGLSRKSIHVAITCMPGVDLHLEWEQEEPEYLKEPKNTTVKGYSGCSGVIVNNVNK